MATQDWYRNTTWDNYIESDFEARLKRSRGAFSKAQYLRIQASYLLSNVDKSKQLVGVRLMERLINDFPKEQFSIILGQEQLGDYYLETDDLEKAEYYFRIVTNHYKNKNSRSGTSAISDLKLAKVILATNNSDKFEEAYRLCRDFPPSELGLNSDRFYYFELCALLCDKMNKTKEAKEFVKLALEIAKIKEPEFSRHKTVGLVNVTEQQLHKLQQILRS